MHIGDGFLDVTTSLGTGLAAAGSVAVGLRRVRADVSDRVVPLMGMMAACVFSAQMINFPVLAGMSGHLMGGVLVAIVLGPWAGMLAMSVVLLVQCLLFQDGGVTALGANMLNMAVVGPLAGYGCYALVRRCVHGNAGHVAGAVVAAWFSVVVASALCAAEFAAAGVYPLEVGLPAMVIVHSVIGVFEGAITGLVVSFLLQVKPDMLHATSPAGPLPRQRWTLAVGLAAALLIAFFLSPLASAAPDGLEYVAAQLGLHPDPNSTSSAVQAIVPERNVAGLATPWLATSLAGGAGACAVFGLAWGMTRVSRYGVVK